MFLVTTMWKYISIVALSSLFSRTPHIINEIFRIGRFLIYFLALVWNCDRWKVISTIFSYFSAIRQLQPLSLLLWYINERQASSAAAGLYSNLLVLRRRGGGGSCLGRMYPSLARQAGAADLIEQGAIADFQSARGSLSVPVIGFQYA